MVDFSSFKGKNLTLAHRNIFADTEYIGSDKVMQFNVKTVVTNRANNGPVPSKLVDIKFPQSVPTVERSFNFIRNIGQPWTINGLPWSNPISRVQVKPALGAIDDHERGVA